MLAAGDPPDGPARKGNQAISEREGEVSAKQITDRTWELVESGQLDRIEEVMHPDVEFRGVGAEAHGIEELRGFLEAYLEGFPDLRHEVVDYVESGDTIALELHVTGTHT